MMDSVPLGSFCNEENQQFIKSYDLFCNSWHKDVLFLSCQYHRGRVLRVCMCVLRVWVAG